MFDHSKSTFGHITGASRTKELCTTRIWREVRVHQGARPPKERCPHLARHPPRHHHHANEPTHETNLTPCQAPQVVYPLAPISLGMHRRYVRPGPEAGHRVHRGFQPVSFSANCGCLSTADLVAMRGSKERTMWRNAEYSSQRSSQTTK